MHRKNLPFWDFLCQFVNCGISFEIRSEPFELATDEDPPFADTDSRVRSS